ncbi:MAG: Asp-tRNA(Asn)/Glu-tRNA(Gln) amidotransferase subunit GatB [Endomicrobia bacterium]|nr:Asp-tRNA(Asn)/Glu-tRNA(Gln) amidotransferase subunit GatB [Endomicrobiia bacterium]
MNSLPVIGLEVHVQLKTKTKMFCSCSVEFGVEPNKNICPICTGQPGVLPTVNKKAVELAVKTALALNCKVHNESVFARKNYYYPDLPKNYQISQYESPLATDGFVEIELKKDSEKIYKKVYIKRVHIEEDAGKLLHAIGKEELDYSLIDYNRAGTPLLEIVSQPCLYSVEEAISYLVTLRDILRFIDVSDCDLEKGTFRVDANVSIAEVENSCEGEKLKLGTKTEIKNMNSFKAIKEALTYEIERQRKILTSGNKVVQETRLWSEELGVTKSMRTKEEAHDYRYFPEPDLLPLEIEEIFIEEIKKSLPELPLQKKKRFKNIYNLPDSDIDILVSEKVIADYFERVLTIYSQSYTQGDFKSVAKTVSNLIITEILGLINQEGLTFDKNKIKEEYLAELVKLYYDGVLSSKLLKEVLEEVWYTQKSPKEIVQQKGISQISDIDELKKVIQEVIAENQKVVDDYKSGKTQAISALIGQIMKKTKGKANPQLTHQLLKDILDK